MKTTYVTAILASTLVLTSLAAVAQQDRKPKNPCRIDISFPHISTNIDERQGIRAVKVNAFSICNRPHSHISLTVQLWKENKVFKEMLIETVARQPKLVPAGARFYNENTFVPCLNYKMTNYYGIAFAKAKIDGKWYIAQHKLEVEIPPIRCGT